VLRRLDCVLAPTKDRVLAEAKIRQAEGLHPEPFLLRITGVPFANTSPFDLKKLMGDQDNLATNLDAYIQSFSAPVRDIFERFRFAEQVERIRKANLLYQMAEKFADFDLHSGRVGNHDMGLAFEELIRKFAEISNETAGEHFTPRDVIRLMVNLLFIEDSEILTPGTRAVRIIYDPKAGTGGMLSVARWRSSGYGPFDERSVNATMPGGRGEKWI
jgi:type I restriction enzyme M protein